ncbi:MAG: DUF3805 domain-containing protein [Bacteroides sp.]|nr:DUF3805 domain-containing protein [Bacteroides sp.]
MKQSKKYIAPGAWFSMLYPADWNEFEENEGTFLFYNPDNWTGNFRISAYRGHATYATEAIRAELKENPSAQLVTVGTWSCAYSKKMFEEAGSYYTSHVWLTGKDELLFECSMTVVRGASVAEAEAVIASLEVRKAGEKYPAELIPIRVSEIYQINEAYEWVEKTVKEVLTKDFQGVEEDVEKMQAVVDKGIIPPKKKEPWLALGIALCVILVNEADGMEWRTLIDGNREVPVLLNSSTGKWIDPMKLAWSKVKAGEACNLLETYQSL